ETATRRRCATMPSSGNELLRGRGQPAALEAGPGQALADVRVLAHHAPDHRAPIVLDHRENRALVDAQVVAVDPAKARDAFSGRNRTVEVEIAIEGVEEAVLRIDVFAE